MSEPIGVKVEETDVVEHECDCPEPCGDDCKCDHGHLQETPEPIVPPKASDFLAGIERQPNELYCDYKCRLWWEKSLLRQYLGGRSVWIGRDKGEARNMMRSQRDSKLRNKKDAQKERVQAIHQEQGVRTIDELNTTKKKKKELKELAK